jgi:hypothetical protein
VGRNPYLIINIILAGLILLIFIYSGLFDADRANHPVPSYFEKFTGTRGPSSGMSRAFSELIRGDIESARSFNEDSTLIFAFFLVQLVQRTTMLLLLIKTRLKYKTLMIADIVFSLILFMYCFKGQMIKMAELMKGV